VFSSIITTISPRQPLTLHPQRLAKWFTTLSPKDKAKIIKDVSQLVLARRTRMCNFLEYKGSPSLAVVPHQLDSPYQDMLMFRNFICTSCCLHHY
jgi:hypothetical protein